MIEPLAVAPSKLRCLVLAAAAALAGPLMLIHSPAAAAATIQSDHDISYVLIAAGSRSSTMSGSTDDLRRAHALRNGREGLLYVRDGGAAYIIRDAATLREAGEIFAPQEALGARQGALGARQAALGRRQAQLGAEQARLGRRQAEASPARADELGRQQNALGEQQNALGEQQNVLGEQQNALGREQDRLARLADARMRALIAEAVRRGVAQRVD